MNEGQITRVIVIQNSLVRKNFGILRAGKNGNHFRLSSIRKLNINFHECSLEFVDGKRNLIVRRARVSRC